MAYRHASGPVLHHDLKSANVLVFAGDNGALTPKLCDFGLATPLDPTTGLQEEVRLLQGTVAPLVGKARLPSARTPHASARWLQGPRPLLPTPERRPSRLGACRGPRSPPPAAPKKGRPRPSHRLWSRPPPLRPPALTGMTRR